MTTDTGQAQGYTLTEATVKMADDPGFGDICFNSPLYSTFTLDDVERDKLWAYKGKMDAYCVQCKNSTIFHNISTPEQHSVMIRQEEPYIIQFHVDFYCARDTSHINIFVFLRIDDTLHKIGQFPSLADTAISELGRYRKVLENEVSGEFYKALGLAAHDVGIGSFVYLRRVLEELVENRKVIAIASGDKKEEEFEGKRFVERIKLLKGYLPDLLVENTAIYTILSKGIHDLNEQECLKYFPIMRELMFLILEEDLETKEKQIRRDNVAAELKKLS